jgi:hypothetical protein
MPKLHACESIESFNKRKFQKSWKLIECTDLPQTSEAALPFHEAVSCSFS